MLELVKEHWFCAFILAFTALCVWGSIATTFFESWAARGRPPSSPDDQEDAQGDDQDDHEVQIDPNVSLIEELRDEMRQRANPQTAASLTALKKLGLEVDHKDEVPKPKSRYDRI